MYSRLTVILPFLFSCVFPAALSGQAPAWMSEFQGAAQQLQAGDPAGATGRFNAVWKANPQDFRLAYQIGTVLDMAGQHQQATSWYQRCLKLNPSFAPAQNNLSLNYASLGEFAKALPLLEGLSRRNPTDGRLFYNLGLMNLQLKRFRAAAQAFQRAHELKPDERDPLIRLAYASLLGGQRQQGLAAIKAFVQLPGDRRASALQAVQVLNSARLYRDALSQARELAAAAGSPQLSLEEAAALFHLGEYRQASDLLAKLPVPEGRELDYHLLLGSAQALAGNLPGAVSSLQAAVRLNPRTAESYYRLALVFIQGSRDDDARAVLAAGLEQLPGSALLWYARGVVDQGSGKDEEAIRSLDRSIQIKRDQPDAWSLRGELEARLGDYDPALESFRTALKLGAEPETAVKYAELLVRLERYDEAEKVLQQVLSNGAGSAHVYRGLGKLYKARQEYARAYEALRRAVELDPDDADAHFQLGEALRWLGRPKEARQEYTIAAEKKKANAEASRLLRRVIAPVTPGTD